MIKIISYYSQLWGPVVLYHVGNYRDGSPVLKIARDQGESICTLTVNVDAGSRKPGTYIVKTWSENAETAAELLELGFFRDTGRRITIEFVQAQIWERT